MKTLSIDPGLRSCGVAVWEDGKLLYAKYVKSNLKNPPPQVFTDTVKAVAKTCGKKFDEIVVEYPQVYKERFQKGRQKDIVDLAGLVGAIIAEYKSCKSYTYLPREWKGQCPKSVTQYRVLKNLSHDEHNKIHLTQNEKLNYNIFDAIGVGMYHLKRPRD